MFNYLVLLLLFIFILLYNNDLCMIYVQLSASHTRYIAYLPIVIRAWNRIGYCAIAIIAFHRFTKEIMFIKNKLKELKCFVYLLQLNNSLSLHYSSKLARIYGFTKLSNLKRNTYFYLPDADMIPISRKYFQDMNKNKLIIKSFDKNGYGFGNNKGRWAMCYFVANRFVWEQIFSQDLINENIQIITSHIIEKELNKGIRYFEDFAYIDEVFMRDKIKEWSGYNTSTVFHKRDYSSTRIDRSKWPKDIFKINKNAIIDVHLPKLPKENEKIKKIWNKKIIPLQLLLFNYTPYDLKYLRYFIYNNEKNNSIKKEIICK